jgi:putative transposase
MKYSCDVHDPDHPPARHKTTRLKGFDYGSDAGYVVTICTRERRHLLGSVRNGQVGLTDVGRLVEGEWLRTPLIRAGVLLDEFVIMPNHLHGILILSSSENRKIVEAGKVGRSGPSQTLSAIVRGFKGACSSRVAKEMPNVDLPLWQPGFYDRVIRDEAELRKFREYIANNPRQWELDRYNEVSLTHIR